ncbi:hypothetical protein ACTFIT_007972 [Dictyostelium discoideum]
MAFYTFDTKNWSTNGTLSSCVFYDFVNNDYYDLRAIVYPDHRGSHRASFTAELSGGIQTPYTIYFNPCFNDHMCPGGLSVGCLFYDLTPMKLLTSTSHQITNDDHTKDILFNLFGNVNRCGTFGTSTLSYQSCILTVANKAINYKLDSRYATSPKSVMVGSLSQPRTITFTNDVITIIYSSTTGFTECSSNGNKYSSKYILICDPFTEYYVDKFTLESQCIYQIKVYTKYACPTLRLFKQTQYYDLSPLMLDSARNYTTSHFTDGSEFFIVFNIGNKAQMCSDALNDYYFSCQYEPRQKFFYPLAKASLGHRVTFDLNQVKFEYTSPSTTTCSSNSYKRDLIVILNCDENQHYQLVSTLESPTCVYTITIKTKYVCESTIYYNRINYTYYDITPIKTTKDSPKTVDIVVGGYPYKLYYGIGNTVNYCSNQVESVPGVDYQACQYLSGLVIQVGSLKNTSMYISNNGISIYHTTPFDLTRSDTTAINVVVSATETANYWACEYTIEIKTKYACPINYAPVLPVVGNPCLYTCTPPGALNPKAIACFSEINKYGTGAQSLLVIFNNTWVLNHNGYDDWMGGQLYSLLLTGKPQTSISPYVSSITHDNLCTYGTNGLSKAKNSINDFLTITNDLLEISNRAASSTVTKYTYSDGEITLSTHKLLSTSTGGLAIIKYKNLLCYYSIVSNLQTLVISNYLLSCPYYSPTITVFSLTPSTGQIGDIITINGQNLDTNRYDVYFNIIDDNSKIKATITSNTDIINRFFVIGQNHRSLITNITIYPYIDNIEKETIYCEIEKYCPSSSKIPSIPESAVGHPYQINNQSLIGSPNSVTFNNVLSSSWKWINSTHVKAIVQKGIGAILTIVNVGSQSTETSPYPVIFYKQPELDNKKYENFANSNILITGSNFVPVSVSAGSSSSVKIGGIPCNSVTWVDSKSVICNVLIGTGDNLNIQVTVGGQQTELNNYFSYLGQCDFLCSDLSNLVILIDNIKCEEIKWIDSTKVSCQVPVGQGKDLSIKVKIENQETEENQQFSYDKPFIQSINPIKGRCNQEVLITIQGDSFGKSDQLIKIGNNECQDIQFYPNHTFTCKVPIVENSIESIVLLNIGNQDSNDNITYKYYGPPEIKSIGLPSHLSFKGDDLITIIGNNFIEYEDGSDEIVVKFNNEPTTIIENTETYIKIKILSGDEFNVTATAILISGGSTQSPTPTIAPTISPTPTPTDNYWVRCMVDYSRLTLQVDNLYGQDIVCIDGNGISSIFNESFSCKPDLINDGMICAQQHQDGTNSTTTFGNSTLICHIDSTKSCEISPPFIIPSDPIEEMNIQIF